MRTVRVRDLKETPSVDIRGVKKSGQVVGLLLSATFVHVSFFDGLYESGKEPFCVSISAADPGSVVIYCPYMDIRMHTRIGH